MRLGRERDRDQAILAVRQQVLEVVLVVDVAPVMARENDCASVGELAAIVA